MEDPRKTGLKNGLRQLTPEQLLRVLKYPGEMVLDTYNYEDGKFCPLAVAVGLDSMENPSHEKVYDELVARGYKVYNTRGIDGNFYTTNRKSDLMEAALEVYAEKIDASWEAAQKERAALAELDALLKECRSWKLSDEEVAALENGEA